MKTSGKQRLPKTSRAQLRVSSKRTTSAHPKRSRVIYRYIRAIISKIYRGVQGIVIASAFAITFVYAGMSIVNTNDTYKEDLTEYIVQRVPGTLQLQELSLGWDGIFPGILAQDISWRSPNADATLYASQGTLSINPVAPLYGGSLVFVKLEDADFLLAQDLLRSIGDQEAEKATVEYEDTPDISIPHIDIIINDAELTTRENSGFVLDLDSQVIRLRKDEQIMRIRGQLSYGVNRFMKFYASLIRRDEEISLYAEVEEINLETGWDNIIEGFDLPEEMLNFTATLDSVKGSGRVWIAQNQVQEISIQTDLNLEQLSLNSQRNIDMGEIQLVAELLLSGATDAELSGNDGEPPTRDSWQLLLKEFAFNMRDKFGDSRRLEFADIQVNKHSQGLDIMSPQLQLEDASYFAINTLTQQKTINNITEYDTHGSIENLLVKIRNKTQLSDNKTSNNNNSIEPNNFTLDGRLVDVTTNPVLQIPGAIKVSGNLAIRDNKGWFAIDDYDSDLYLPKLYPAPFHFGYVSGIFMWEWIEPGALLLVGKAHDIKDDALRASMQMSLYSVPLQHGYIDLEVGGSNLNLQQARSFIPWKTLTPNTAQWLNKSLVGGTTTKLALSMRGDVKDFGLPQTIFELGLSLEDGELKYREDKAPIESSKFDVFMNTDSLDVILPQGGNIGEIAELESGYGVVDIATTDFALGGTGNIYLAAAPELLYDYIIKGEGEPPTWRMHGNATGDWEFQYNLRSAEFLDADLNLSTVASEVIISEFPNYKITNITGSMGISELGYTGIWDAYYEGEKFTGGFFDTPRGNVFRLSGVLSVPGFLSPYVNGKSEISIEAYTKARGELLFSHYEITSDMRGIELNLPYPLNKRAATSLPLTIGRSEKGTSTTNYITLASRAFLGWRTLNNGNNDDKIDGVEILMPGKRVISPQRLSIAKGLLLELSAPVQLDFDKWQESLTDAGVIDALTSNSDNARSTSSAAENLPQMIYTSIAEFIRQFPYGNIDMRGFTWQEHKYDYVGADYDTRQDSWINFAVQRPDAYRTNGRFRLIEPSYKVLLDIDDITITDADDSSQASSESAQNNRDAPAARLLSYIPQKINPPKDFSKFPSVDLNIQGIYYGRNFIGSINANIITTANQLQAIWDDSQLLGLTGSGRFSWALRSPSSSELSIVTDWQGNLNSEYINNLVAQGVNIHFDWAWQGDNVNFYKWPETATSSLGVSSTRGTIVSDRANILINVVSFLNFNSYVQAATGDLTSFSNTGSTVSYSKANVNLDLNEGAYIVRDDTQIVLSFIKIDGSGSYALVEDNLDLVVTVTSPTASVLPLTALVLGASALAPLLISIDLAGGDFINRFSSAVYQVNGTLANPQSSLARISDISGKKLDPDDLVNQLDIRSRLDNFRF
ncbi:MAG: hypothetical protein K0U41_05210 [Gammaproteobacteria bacterium]|nr:hypothetical protein [Gammaproteobacteria bacterium]